MPSPSKRRSTLKYFIKIGIISEPPKMFLRTEHGLKYLYDIEISAAFTNWARLKRDATRQIAVSFAEFYEQLPIEKQKQIIIKPIPND